MEPSGYLQPARLEGQQQSKDDSSHMQGNPAGKISYADKTSTPSSSSTVDLKKEKEKARARHTTHISMPVSIFKASDYYGIMDESCKFTIVGRFLRPRPQINRIRSRFKEIVPLKELVRIGFMITIMFLLTYLMRMIVKQFGFGGSLKLMVCECDCKNGLQISSQRKTFMWLLCGFSCLVCHSICMIDIMLNNF